MRLLTPKVFNVSTRSTVFRCSEVLDWSQTLLTIDEASKWAQELVLRNLRWPQSCSLSSPLVPRTTYEHIYSLSLRGNDVLSLLPLLNLPNLECLTLVLTEDATRTRPTSPISPISPRFPRFGFGTRQMVDYYDLLVDFVNAHLGKQNMQALRNISISDPFITDSQIAYILSHRTLRDIPTLTIRGFPDVFGRISTFLTSGSSAFQMLGGRRGGPPSIKVWFFEFDGGQNDSIYDPDVYEARVGWTDRWDGNNKLLLECSPREGEVHWANGRYHRLIGSC